METNKHSRLPYSYTIRLLEQYVSDKGVCGDAEDGSNVCSDADCAYCKIVALVEGVVNFDGTETKKE